MKTICSGLLFMLLMHLFLVQSAQAAISYVASATALGNDDLGSLTLPASVQANDVILAQVTIRRRTGGNNVTTPSGWTLLGSQIQDDDVLQSLYYRVAASGDASTSHTWDFDGNGNRRYILGALVFRGVDTANPVNVFSTAISPAADTVMTASSVTTTQANTYLVAFYGLDTGDRTMTAAAGMSEVYEREESTASAGLTVMAAHEALAASGATGNRAATASDTFADGVAHLVALQTAIPVISIATPSEQDEGDSGTSTLSFTVSLNVSNSVATSATYAVTSGSMIGGATCAAGIDFINTSGTITIASGNTSATISVTICGDTNAEGDETLTVTLSNPTNATLGTASAIGTILDDDFIAEWRMDEASWNGTTNEVLDSSGSGHHGTASISAGSTPRPTTTSGSPAYTSGSQSTCRYGQFDTTSSPVRTYGTVVGSTIPALPSSFTFSAWIRSTNPSQSGQRILVRDDAQNGWGFSLGDPGSARVRFFNRNIGTAANLTGNGSIGCGSGTFCLDTAAVITANNWFYVAVTIDTVAKRITHYVFNQAGTLLSNTSATYPGTWADGTGVLALGGETAASSEGRTAAFHFNGNIDEVRISYGALSQSRIQSLMTRTRSCTAAIDHFELSYAAPALTCEPHDVTVSACTNASCSTVYSGSVTAALTPTGWVGGNLKTFSTGSASYELQRTTAGTVTLGVTSSTPSATGTTLCRINGGAASTTCSLTFDTSGLAFDVPNLIANRPSGTVKVRAVKMSDTSVACVPAFVNVSRNVGFYSTYVNPGPLGRPDSRSVLFNDTAPAIPISQSSGTPTVRSLSFDASGEADINVSYPDAGQMQLTATYTGSAATSDTGLSMTGNDTFVSRPAGLCVSTASSCATGDATCSVFARAGENFNLDVNAVGWESDGDTDLCDNAADTPNYAQSNISLSQSLVAPAGGDAGSVSPIQYNHVASLNATTTTATSLSEVGVFRITATPPAYFGETIPAPPSANIGRIIPDHFEVAINPGTFAQGCDATAVDPTANPFTYIGQPFSYGTVPTLTITARNASGGTTTNYTSGAFRKLQSAHVYSCVDTPSTVEGVHIVYPCSDVQVGADGSTLMAVSSTPFDGALTFDHDTNPGVITYTFDDDDVFEYEKDSNSAVAPFTSDLNITINSISDGEASAATPLPLIEPTPVNLRYGRWFMESLYGPEIMPLLMTAEAQYLADGSGTFLTNDRDDCTVLSLSTDQVGTVDTNGFTDIPLSAGSLPAGSSDFTYNKARLIDGDGAFTFSAPGSGHTGSIDVLVDLSGMDWLRFDWDGDGDLDSDDDRPAKATFGQYRGHDRIIYWREVEN